MSRMEVSGWQVHLAICKELAQLKIELPIAWGGREGERERERERERFKKGREVQSLS